jgi:hypothetical protein
LLSFRPPTTNWLPTVAAGSSLGWLATGKVDNAARSKDRADLLFASLTENENDLLFDSSFGDSSSRHWTDVNGFEPLQFEQLHILQGADLRKTITLEGTAAADHAVAAFRLEDTNSDRLEWLTLLSIDQATAAESVPNEHIPAVPGTRTPDLANPQPTADA